MGDSARSSHDRYGDVFQLMMERDRELAHAFNTPRRSRAISQLALIVKLDLLVPEELARFTPGIRDSVMELTKGMQPPRVRTQDGA